MVTFQFLFNLVIHVLLHVQATSLPANEEAMLLCVTSLKEFHLEAVSSRTSSKSLNCPVDSLSSIPTFLRDVSTLLHSVTLPL